MNPCRQHPPTESDGKSLSDLHSDEGGAVFVEYITLVLLVTIPVGIALYAVMPQVYSIYTMGRAVILFPFP